MIEMQRTAPARILKSRDVVSGEAVKPALASIEPALPRAGTPAPARCVAKEARVVAADGGATAIEVRCSCGEWTRVELQVGEQR